MKILLVLGGGIGNVVQATPIIQIIASTKHVLDLKLFCDTKDVKEIFSLPNVRKVYVLDDPKDIYDCQLNGIFTPGRKYRAKNYFKTRINYAQNQPESNVYADLLKQIGISFSQLPDAKINIISGPSPKYPDTVAIYPGSKENWAMKRWDKFDELANKFNHVTVIGTPKDISSHGNPAWISKPWNWPKHVEFFSGSLSQAAHFISKCKIFIGNDGGLSHVAAATGIPTFVLFGPSSDIKNKPFAKNARVIALSLPCRPCQFKVGPGGKQIFNSNKSDCPYNMKCMRDMTSEYVCSLIG